MNDTERRWLVVFVCPCPNCGQPRVEYLFPAFLPDAQQIKEFVLGNLPCDRCQLRWQPNAQECFASVHPQLLKKDFQSYKQDK
jgi:hypothetical protein